MQRVEDCPLAYMENCRDYWNMPDDATWLDPVDIDVVDAVDIDADNAPSPLDDSNPGLASVDEHPDY